MPSLATTVSPVLPPLFVAAVLWLCLAIGRRLLVWLGASSSATTGERAIVALAAGVGALQLLPFTLGLAGVLGVRGIRLATAALAVAAARDLVAIARSTAPGWRRPRLDGGQIAWVLALLPAVIVAFLLALAPTTDPDGLGYHLTVPKRWMASGSLLYLPTYMNSNAPMGMEMLFAVAMAFVGDIGAKLLHFALGVFAAAGLVLAGRRLYGSMVGRVAATLFLVGPAGIIGLLGCAHVEGGVALMMTAAVVAWLVWFQSGDRGWLRCAALLAGFAVSFKITSAIFPLALAALTCMAMLRDVPARSSARVFEVWTSVGRLVPFAAAPVLPWMLRSAVLTGNPFYPLFALWIPTRDLPPAGAAALVEHFRYWNWGTRLGPEWTTTHRAWLLRIAAAALILAGVVALSRVRSWMARGTVITVVGMAVMYVFAIGLYVRYWEMFASILMLPLVAAAGRTLDRPWAPAVLVAATVVMSSVQITREVAEVSGDTPGLVRTALGLEDRQVFLARHLAAFPLHQFANAHLPANARILLTYNCHGFYLDRTTYCDESFQDVLRWGSWQDLSIDLERLGVTHVIAPSAIVSGGSGPPASPTRLLLNTPHQDRVMARVLSEHPRPLATMAGQGLFALKPPGGVSVARGAR